MVRKSNKQKRGSSASWVPRGGFSPGFGIPKIPYRATAEQAYKYARKFGEEYARNQWKRATKHTLDAAKVYIETVAAPQAVKVGNDIIGKIAGAANATVSGSATPSAFIQMDAEKQRYTGGTNTSLKQYYTTFESGKPAPKVTRLLARQQGTVEKSYWNSIYDTGTTTQREALRLEAGFNQKLLYTYPRLRHNLFHMTEAYSVGDLKPLANKEQTLYGQTLYLWRKLQIMNTNSFLPVVVKIKLWKANFGTTVSDRLSDSFMDATEWLTKDVQVAGKLPLKYQLGPVTTVSDSKRVLVDPSVSFNAADNWSSDFTQVKSFSKRLKPGEIWNWSEKYHCGAGLDLLEMQRVFSELPACPLGYDLTIEVQGVKCQGIYGANTNQHLIGLGPSYVQIEHSGGHCSVNGATNEEFYLNDITQGGMNSSRFAIRVFTKRETDQYNQRIQNFDASKVSSTPTTVAEKIYIPVMADTTVQYAKERGDD